MPATLSACEAASYSLGLCTYADINLARLEQFGAVRFLDQRQARRYSDRGLLQLARLISTHWTTQTVPEATLILVGLDESRVGLTVQLRWQRHIHIHPPKLSLWRDGQPHPAPFAATWTDASEPDALWHEHELAEPTVVELEGEATVRLVWRGETWPTFIVVLTGDIHADMVKSQTLAAACAVTMVRCPWPCAETGVAKRRTGQEPASCDRVDVLAHPDKRSLRATVFGGNRKKRGSHKGSAALARSMVPCSSCASLPLSRLCKVPRNCS